MNSRYDVQKERMGMMEKVIEEYFRRYHPIIVETIDSEKPYFFKYSDPIYELTGRDFIRIDLCHCYDRLVNSDPDFRKSDLPLSYLGLAVKEVMKRAPKYSPDVFYKNEGGVYRIPGKKNDLLVNPNTGELRAVERDPINYPSVIALPYDFSKNPPKEMPEELKEVLTITPPSFREALLYELVSPLTFQKQLFVNYIVDKHYEAQYTLNEVFETLYARAIGYSNFFEPGISRECMYSDLIWQFAIHSYLFHTSEIIKSLMESPMIVGRIKYHHNVVFRNRFPIIIDVTDNRDLLDPNLIEDMVIIPITDTVLGKRDPRYGGLERWCLNWSEETKEEIVLWLIHNVLIKSLRGGYKNYMDIFPKETIISWRANGMYKIQLEALRNS